MAHYYENSVTMGLSACRRSHVPLRRNVLAQLRCPIHVLQCAHCASPIGQGVVWKKVDPIHTDGVGSTDVLPTSVSTTAGHWGSGNQLSPYCAGVAGPCHTRLLTTPAFQPCSCSLALSGLGEAVASESFALNSGLLRKQFTPCVTRRTLPTHPALTSALNPQLPRPPHFLGCDPWQMRWGFPQG